MILVFGGTTEANEITEALLNEGHAVTVSRATKIPSNSPLQRGEKLLPFAKGGREGFLTTISGQLDKASIATLLQKQKFKAVIDATHPFALQISQNAKEACAKTKTPYYRFERKNAQITSDNLIIHVPNFEEAAEKAASLGKNIFLTIGVNNIEPFVKKARDNITARVLNQEKSIQKCLEAGVRKNNIIAENGPFSTSQNTKHFLEHDAEVVVSKDSGEAGGLSEKVKACAQLQLPLVLIERPPCEKEAIYEIDKLLKAVSAA